MSSDTIIIEANFDLAAWNACKRTWVLTSYCLFVLWATKEFFSPLFNLVIGLNIAVFTSLSFTSVLPFSIFYGFISVIIKYDIDPVTGSTFIKNSAKQSFSNNSNCLLITSQTLNNSHLINFYTPRVREWNLQHGHFSGVLLSWMLCLSYRSSRLG